MVPRDRSRRDRARAFAAAGEHGDLTGRRVRRGPGATPFISTRKASAAASTMTGRVTCAHRRRCGDDQRARRPPASMPGESDNSQSRQYPMCGGATSGGAAFHGRRLNLRSPSEVPGTTPCRAAPPAALPPTTTVPVDHFVGRQRLAALSLLQQ
jgi:hypothetical protein